MQIVRMILTVLEVLASVALIVVVLLQTGKESGLSGTISGNTDTYMGKGKSSTWDKKLASSTKWIALAWILLTMSLHLV